VDIILLGMIVFSAASSHVKLVPEMNPAYDIDSNLSPGPMDCPSRLNWNVGTAVRHLGDWIRREAHLGNCLRTKGPGSVRFGLCSIS
jgi:hypothetical protein